MTVGLLSVALLMAVVSPFWLLMGALERKTALTHALQYKYDKPYLGAATFWTSVGLIGLIIGIVAFVAALAVA